jgi:hypothetical protein
MVCTIESLKEAIPDYGLYSNFVKKTAVTAVGITLTDGKTRDVYLISKIISNVQQLAQNVVKLHEVQAYIIIRPCV